MWLWYDWSNGYHVWAIYMNPETAIRRLATEGYGKIALVPIDQDITDLDAAIKAYEEAEHKS